MSDQDLANGIQNVFSCSPLMGIMAMDDTPSGFYAKLAVGFLDMAAKKAELMTFLETTDLKPITLAWMSIEKFCRSILHIHNCKIPDKDGRLVSIPPDDVFYFTQYNGKRPFERSVRAAYAREGTWWSKQVDEIKQTAGSRALLQPKLETFTQILEEAEPHVRTAGLQDIHNVFGELRSSLRSLELEPLMNKYASLTIGAVKDLMKPQESGASVADAARVSILFQMLEAASSRPSVVTVLNEFKEWANETRAARALSSCTALMAACTRTEIDLENIKKNLPAETVCDNGDDAELAPYRAACVNFMSKLLLFALDKAG